MLGEKDASYWILSGNSSSWAMMDWVDRRGAWRVPGVNSQGAPRDELLLNLREALVEAIEMNREDVRNAAGESFEEVAILLTG